LRAMCKHVLPRLLRYWERSKLVLPRHALGL